MVITMSLFSMLLILASVSIPLTCTSEVLSIVATFDYSFMLCLFALGGGREEDIQELDFFIHLLVTD